MGQGDVYAWGRGPLERVPVRDAIRRDCELVFEAADRVRSALSELESMARRNMARVASGESAGGLAVSGADTLDMACLAMVRRIDHMSALVEVAFANEVAS